jgi:hypothetical protein
MKNALIASMVITFGLVAWLVLDSTSRCYIFIHNNTTITFNEKNSVFSVYSNGSGFILERKTPNVDNNTKVFQSYIAAYTENLSDLTSGSPEYGPPAKLGKFGKYDAAVTDKIQDGDVEHVYNYIPTKYNLVSFITTETLLNEEEKIALRDFINSIEITESEIEFPEAELSKCSFLESFE